MTSIVRKGFIYFTLVAMGGIFSLEAYASDVYRGNGHSFLDSDSSDESQEPWPFFEQVGFSFRSTSLESTEESLSKSECEESQDESQTEKLCSKSEDDESQYQMNPEGFFDGSRKILMATLMRELTDLQSDAEAYIMCHTDLKILAQKGNVVFQSLLRMKEIGIATNTDLITPSDRNILGSDFFAQYQSIPMILSLGSDQLSTSKNYFEALIIPNEQIILIPTFKSIVESLQGLTVTTREESVKAQDILDALLPKTVEIICDILAKAGLVYKLIEMNGILVDRVNGRASRLQALIRL